MQIIPPSRCLLVSAFGFAKRCAVILLLALVPALAVQAQGDVFMRLKAPKEITLPPGESADPVYRGADGWFRIKSFSLGAETGTVSSSTLGSPRTALGFIALDVGKEINVVSPSIFSVLAKGGHFEKVEIVVRKPGARDGLGYLLYEFGVAAPLAQKWVGNEEERGETVRIGYDSFRFTYRPQSASGELGAPQTAAWTFSKNQDVFGTDEH